MNLLSQFEAFHDQARQATGLDDFGPDDYLDPMRRLLGDYDKYNNFTEAGEQITSATIVGMLFSRLVTEEGFKLHPQYANAPVEGSIVILGPPRTGSTALHRFLARDPDSQWLPPWLGSTPMPRPPRETWESHPYFQQFAQGLEQFYRQNPNVKKIHPMLPAEPDECRFAIDQSFWSPGLAGSMVSPEYSEWALHCDARFAYRRYRRTLGLVAGGDARRWVLKDQTCHLWGPDALLAEFPDSRIVYTHRDPIDAIVSLANLIHEVDQVREPGVSPMRVRDQVLFYAKAMAKTDKFLRQLNPDRLIDVHIREFKADPMGTAERIYRHFNLPIPEETRRAWQRFSATDPEGGHGFHQFRLEDFGLTKAEVYASIGTYRDHYEQLYPSGGAPSR